MATPTETIYIAPRGPTPEEDPQPSKLMLRQYTLKDMYTHRNRNVQSEFISFGESMRSDENIKLIFAVRALEKTLKEEQTRTSKKIEELETDKVYQRQFKALFVAYISNGILNISSPDRNKFDTENRANHFTLESFLKICQEIEISLNLEVFPKFLKSRKSRPQEQDAENKQVTEEIEADDSAIRGIASTIQKHLTEYLELHKKDKTSTQCCCLKNCTVDKKAVYDNLELLSQSIVQCLTDNPNDVNVLITTISTPLETHRKLVGSTDLTDSCLVEALKGLRDLATGKTTVRCSVKA